MNTDSTPSTNAGIVTVSRVFDAPAERVWHALTNPHALRDWLFPVSDFKPEVGFEFNFTVEHEGFTYVHLCRVTEAEPQQRLAYTWRYDGYEGDALVTIVLEKEGAKTKLTLTHAGLDTFPQTPQFARTNFERGWTSLIGTCLKEFLEQPDTSDREIVISRLVSAPRELVWQTFTDPQHICNWWGPRGFTTTTHSHELKPGGIWRYTMHGPDGRDYPNQKVYHEIVAPERLSYSHGTGNDDYPHKFEVTVTFATEGKQTRITMRSVFQTAASRDYVVREHKAIEGGNQTMDRFEEQLAFAAAGEPFTISRTFDAPRERVWAAFTEVAHLAKWWGPKGFTMKTANVDLRPGGKFHYCMAAPNGAEMWGLFDYREIVPPERLVFINSFSDPEGGIARHPMHTGWPLKMLNVFTFTEAEGKTTVTIRGAAFQATPEERQVYRDGYESMRGGFGGTLARLTEYLAETK